MNHDDNYNLLIERINIASDDIQDIFWDAWEDITSHYPDDEAGDEARMVVLTAVIVKIVFGYAKGFQPNEQKERYDHLMKEFKLIVEKNLG